MPAPTAPLVPTFGAMGPIEFLWHLINLLAVPVLFAGVASAGARMLWRRRLGGVAWGRLLGASAGAAAVAAVAGLIAFGGDGRVAGYSLVVLAVFAVLALAMLRGRL